MTKKSTRTQITLSGCWKDAYGIPHRLNPDLKSLHLFEVWDTDKWVSTQKIGLLPHTPCENPELPEWRGVEESMKWMLDHPGEVLEDREGNQIFYHLSFCSFEHGDRIGRRVCFTRDDVFRPVNGKW